MRSKNIFIYIKDQSINELNREKAHKLGALVKRRCDVMLKNPRTAVKRVISHSFIIYQRFFAVAIKLSEFVPTGIFLITKCMYIDRLME